MTLGGVLRTHMQLIAWCPACLHQVEPNVAALVERYGAEMEVPESGRPAALLQMWQPRLRFRLSGYSPPHE